MILRKTYGQAYLNMGGGRNSDEVAAWPTAEISFMTPAFATTVVHGLRPGEPGFDDRRHEMELDNEVSGRGVDVRRAACHPSAGDPRLSHSHA